MPSPLSHRVAGRAAPSGGARILLAPRCPQSSCLLCVACLAPVSIQVFTLLVTMNAFWVGVTVPTLHMKKLSPRGCVCHTQSHNRAALESGFKPTPRPPKPRLFPLPHTLTYPRSQNRQPQQPPCVVGLQSPQCSCLQKERPLKSFPALTWGVASWICLPWGWNQESNQSSCQPVPLHAQALC